MVDRIRHIRYLRAAASDFLEGQVSLHETIHTLEAVLDVLEDGSLDREFEDDICRLEMINALIHDGNYTIDEGGKQDVIAAATRIMAAAAAHLHRAELARREEDCCPGAEGEGDQGRA